MKIKEIAGKAKESAWIIRSWFRMALLKPSIDCVDGHQRFTRSNSARVEFLLCTKWPEFPPHEIADIFNMASQQKTTQVSI